MCLQVRLSCLGDLLLMRGCFPTLEVPIAFSFLKKNKMKKFTFCDARQRAGVSEKSCTTSDGGKDNTK